MLFNFFKQSLHRDFLEHEICGIASQISGVVLDAGSKNRRYDAYFKNAKEIVAIDRNPEPNKNIISADILKMPFEAANFDAVVSFEVLEYILETRSAIIEISRVLKAGGMLVFSVPFLDPVHGDIDCVRYTYKGWQEMLQPYFEDVQIKSFGGRFSVIWDFYFEKVRNRYNNYLKLILMPFLWTLKNIAKYLDRRENNGRYAMGYFIICKTKKN